MNEVAGRSAPQPVTADLPADPHRLPAPGEWFAADAANHLLDRPRFCPSCGASLERGLVTEWWAADERMFLTWCSRCRWTGNIVLATRTTILEPEH